MTDLVPTSLIESLVGVDRHPTEHWGRAVSAAQTVYILHSADCLALGDDLRDCDFSVALDDGIDLDAWRGYEDRPVRLALADWQLVPAGTR